MGYFDDIDFEEDSRKQKRNKEELIESLLRKGKNSVPDMDLEAIDDAINYLLEKNQHERALNCVNSLLEFFPYSNEIWQRKAIIYDNKGDYPKAIECFENMMKINGAKTTLIGDSIPLDEGL